jgi:hypothetical protein
MFYPCFVEILPPEEREIFAPADIIWGGAEYLPHNADRIFATNERIMLALNQNRRLPRSTWQ